MVTALASNRTTCPTIKATQDQYDICSDKELNGSPSIQSQQIPSHLDILEQAQFVDVQPISTGLKGSTNTWCLLDITGTPPKSYVPKSDPRWGLLVSSFFGDAHSDQDLGNLVPGQGFNISIAFFHCISGSFFVAPFDCMCWHPHECQDPKFLNRKLH